MFGFPWRHFVDDPVSGRRSARFPQKSVAPFSKPKSIQVVDLTLLNPHTYWFDQKKRCNMTQSHLAMDQYL